MSILIASIDHSGSASCVALSSSSNVEYVITGSSKDNFINLWSSVTGALVRTLEGEYIMSHSIYI